MALNAFMNRDSPHSNSRTFFNGGNWTGNAVRFQRLQSWNARLPCRQLGLGLRQRPVWCTLECVHPNWEDWVWNDDKLQSAAPFKCKIGNFCDGVWDGYRRQLLAHSKCLRINGLDCVWHLAAPSLKWSPTDMSHFSGEQGIVDHFEVLALSNDLDFRQYLASMNGSLPKVSKPQEVHWLQFIATVNSMLLHRIWNRNQG